MAADGAPLRLLCLCAAWCHLCGAYAPAFDEALQRLRRDWPALTGHWIDIEDQAELVGELDIETFPTLVLLRGAQAEVLERVVRAAITAPEAPREIDAEVAALARRVDATATR
jgi:thioredoxin 1